MDLDRAARETLDDAVAGLRDLQYVDTIQETYARAAEAAAEGVDREPLVHTDAGRQRILFEAVVYMGALVLEHELGSYLTRRKLLFFREPDRERIEAFRSAFRRYLPEKLRSMGIANEVAATVRLREYTDAARGKRAYERFGVCMGEVLDPGFAVITNIVALESISMLVKAARYALGKQFGGRTS